MFEVVLQFLIFILTFLVFYGFLRKTKLFGEPRRNVVVNSIISAIIAFYVLSASLVFGQDLMKIVSGLLIVLLLIFVAAFVAKGLEPEKKK